MRVADRHMLTMALVIALILLLLRWLPGCGGSAAAYAPVLAQAIETFQVLLDEKGGPQGPVKCEHEVVLPKGGKPGQLLVLCEAELAP